LRSFAAAAESFSPDGAIALLPERGPREIRTAAKALNQMRARIKNLVDDRTRTLVAVGHDLRTPITRLRLSSEFVSDETLRSQMWRDLDQMKAMVDSILVHLREGRSARNLVSVDVAACVQTVCDAFADGGADVRLMQTESASVRAQPDELLRAVSNVVDNAVRYAGGATVSVLRAEGRVTICVEDEGPGIADERKDAMLEPFVRGEPARSMDEESGFGLGLSIARAIVGGIGGKLILADRQPRGLSVRIELPAEAAEPVAAPVGPVPVAALAVEGRARAETGVLTVVKN
jgi:signal transduction histidine kinase